MRYRAFLSYARKDHRCAQWLHASLEGFRTPRTLLAPGGASETVPTRLGPIFRDRTDLSGGGTLSKRIEAALADSEFLIVLCSPSAAGSEWVNRECQLFVEQHGSENVFPVIASGLDDTSNPESDFFPPAIRGLGLLAADLRDGKGAAGKSVGDGKETGRLKLVSGLLKVPLDALIRRERQRLRLLLGSLASAVLVFAAVAVAATWFAYRATIEEERANIQTAEAEAQRNEAIAARDRESLARNAEEAARKAESVAREEENIQKLAAQAAEAVAEEQRDAARRTLGDMYAERGWEAVRANQPLSAMRLAMVGAQVAGQPSPDHTAVLRQAMDITGGSSYSYSLLGKGTIISVSRVGKNRRFALAIGQQISIVDIESGQQIASIDIDGAGRVTSAEFSPSGDQILIQTDAEISLVDIKSGSTVWSLSGTDDTASPTRIIWSLEDRFLLVRKLPEDPKLFGPENSVLEIVSAGTGSVLNSRQASVYESSSWQNFLVSPDKRNVLVGTESESVNETGATTKRTKSAMLVDLETASFRTIENFEDEPVGWFEGGAFFGERGDLWRVDERFEDNATFLQVTEVDALSLTEKSGKRVEEWDNAYSLIHWDEPFELDYSRQRALIWALQYADFRLEVDRIIQAFAKDTSSIQYLAVLPMGRALIKIDNRLFTWERGAPESLSRLDVLLERDGYFLELRNDRLAYLNRVGRVTVFETQPTGPTRCNIADKRYRIDGFEASPDGRHCGYWSGENFLSWNAGNCRDAKDSFEYTIIEKLLGLPDPSSLAEWTVAAISQPDELTAGLYAGWWSTGKSRTDVWGSDGQLRVGRSTLSVRKGYSNEEIKGVALDAPENGAQAFDRQGGGMALSYPSGTIEVWDTRTGKRRLNWESGIDRPLVSAIDARRSRLFVISASHGAGYLVDYSRDVPRSEEIANGFQDYDGFSMPFMSFSPDGRYLQITVYFRGTFVVPIANPKMAASLLDLDADDKGKALKFEAIGFTSDSRLLLGRFSDNFSFGAYNPYTNNIEYVVDVRSMFNEDAQLVKMITSPATNRSAILVSQMQRERTPDLEKYAGEYSTNLLFTLVILDSNTGQQIAQHLLPETLRGFNYTVTRPRSPVGALDFSSDGSTLAWLTQDESFGYRGYSWRLPILGGDFAALKKDACASRLVGLDRILNLKEFNTDRLVQQTWKRDLDVCTGRTWEGFSTAGRADSQP